MRKENAKNEAAARKRWYRQLNWCVHIQTFENYFRQVCHRASTEKFFEVLYVSRNDEHRQIQLFAGKHPIGTTEVIRARDGSVVSERLDVEHGAALVISQAATGEVAIILYPFKSERMSRTVPHITWGIFRDPSEISEHVLDRAVRDFLRYMRVSSVLFAEGWADRIRVRYLEFRTEKFRGGMGFVAILFSHWFWVLLGALGSIASIVSLWK